MATSYLNQANLPRGIRNNNPGNLVYTNINWQGKVPYNLNTDTNKKFEQFYELRYGIRAMMRDIYSDYKKGLTNVKDLITEYAPAFENNTAAYINTVINSIGGNMIGELTQERMISICKAIVLVENGRAYSDFISDRDYQDAIDILGVNLPKKKA